MLTYWAVGLAYTPLAFKGESDGDAEKPAAVAADSARDSVTAWVRASTTAPAPAAATAPSGDSAKALVAGIEAQTDGDGSLLVAFGALFLLVFALPVMVVFGSLPSGLLSAIIIFVGIHQAWRMTVAPPLKVSGPYRVGAQPSAAAG